MQKNEWECGIQYQECKMNKFGPQPQTSNYKLQTSNHKPPTTNIKPQTSNYKPLHIHNEYRNGQIMSYFIDGGAENKIFQAFMPVGAHYQ